MIGLERFKLNGNKIPNLTGKKWDKGGRTVLPLGFVENEGQTM